MPLADRLALESAAAAVRRVRTLDMPHCLADALLQSAAVSCINACERALALRCHAADVWNLDALATLETDIRTAANAHAPE